MYMYRHVNIYVHILYEVPVRLLSAMTRFERQARSGPNAGAATRSSWTSTIK